MEHQANSVGVELESELQNVESIPLSQVREGAESLLMMEMSDELMPVDVGSLERPAVPKGADELVAYYEKQLAATQLVQHRLQRQYMQLTEEKASLEESLNVQTAALQQQLLVVHGKAEQACQEARRGQLQVQDARRAVEEVVNAVTSLAELLDNSGDLQALSRGFKDLAHSTQRIYQAVNSTQDNAQQLLGLQLEIKEACLVSPLLMSSSPRAADLPSGLSALKTLQKDADRLQRELELSRSRERELDDEVQAAHVLFSELEAEVVSLQHRNAQSTAKLQVSHEELVAARAPLVAAQRELRGNYPAAADTLAQGLAKLDDHLTSIREFLERLSMPQDPFEPARSGASQATAPRRSVRLLQVENKRKASVMRKQHTSEPAEEAQEVERLQLLAETKELSARVVELTHEQSALRKHISDLRAHIRVLEVERASLAQSHARQMSVAVAAGAAGAAAAVAVSKASPRSPISQQGQTPSTSASQRATGRSAASVPTDNTEVALALGHRATVLEDKPAVATAERQEALSRASRLEEEIEAMDGLLKEVSTQRTAALMQMKRMLAEQGLSDGGTSATELPAKVRRGYSLRSPHTSMDKLLEACGGTLEGVRNRSPSPVRGQPSDQSFASEAPLPPTSRFTDDSEFHTFLLDPTEPLEGIMRSSDSSPTTTVPGSRSGFLGQDQGDLRASSDTAVEIAQLRAALCKLLVSKAVASAQLAEYEEKLAKVQAAHTTEVEKLREQLAHASEASRAIKLQSLRRAWNGERLRDGGRRDRSRERSQDGASDAGYVTELLQHAASLETDMAELQEAHREHLAQNEEHLAQFRRDHASMIRVLQEQHAEEMTQLQTSCQQQVTDLRHLLQEREEAHHCTGNGLAELQCQVMAVQEDAEEYESQIISLRAELGTSRNVALALKQALSAREQLGYEQEQLVIALQSATDNTKQECSEHLCEVAALRAQVEHQEKKCHDERVMYESHLSGLRQALKLQEDMSSSKEELIRQLGGQVSSLQTTCSELERRIAEHQSKLDVLRAELQQQQVEHATAMADLGASHDAVLAKQHAEFHQQLLSAQQEADSLRADAAQREALILEIRNQMSGLQNEKELTKQSLEHLVMDKQRMLEVIKSLQDELTIVKAQLGPPHEGVSKAFNSRAPLSAPLVGTSTLTVENDWPAAPPSSSPPTVRFRYVAADALAEATIQAALAESTLERLKQGQQTNVPPAVQRVAATHDAAEESAAMMETVALHGELHEVRAKQRNLQEQVNALVNELVCSVLDASRAELELEHMQTERPLDGRCGPVSPHPSPTTQVDKLPNEKRTDDESNKLLRWASDLRRQVSNLEHELSRARGLTVLGEQQSCQQPLHDSDSLLNSARQHIEDMEAELKSLHSRVLRRDAQAATLQETLVQLTEQVSGFEHAVCRCESLSASLVRSHASSV